MLIVILGHTEMAMEQMAPDHPLYPDLLEIHKAADRSANLTRQLLAFARKQTIIFKVLDLNKTVESMLTMLHRLIGEDIKLVWIPGDNLWPVKIDPNIKHLFMSGYPSNTIAHRNILDGGINFIQKPFSMRALAIKLREVLHEDDK